MGEIENDRSNLKDEKMVQITLKAIGPSPPSRLTVPSRLKVYDLRKLIAGNDRLPLENLRLILRGNVLLDNKNGDDVFIQLNDGGLHLIFDSLSS
ncbi:unnamed protein product [Ilex paraguariensis]|uniref:Ubiquitin-like domain-containing protein n=1 Tax=Ilex paraguariensis TaxID=185542 RepID=A0ABC8TZX3_9AQUA